MSHKYILSRAGVLPTVLTNLRRYGRILTKGMGENYCAVPWSEEDYFHVLNLNQLFSHLVRDYRNGWMYHCLFEVKVTDDEHDIKTPKTEHYLANPIVSNCAFVRKIEVIGTCYLGELPGFIKLVDKGLFKGENDLVFDNLKSCYCWAIEHNYTRIFHYLYTTYTGVDFLSLITSDEKQHFIKVMLEGVDNIDIDQERKNIESCAFFDNVEIEQQLLPTHDNCYWYLYYRLREALFYNMEEKLNYYINLAFKLDLRHILAALLLSYAAPRNKIALLNKLNLFEKLNLDDVERYNLFALAQACECDDLTRSLNLSSSEKESCENRKLALMDFRSLTEYYKDPVRMERYFAFKYVLESGCFDKHVLNKCIIQAAKYGYAGVVKLLSLHGADCTAGNNVLIKHANKFNYPELINYLHSLGIEDAFFDDEIKAEGSEF